MSRCHCVVKNRRLYGTDCPDLGGFFFFLLEILIKIDRERLFLPCQSP